MVAIFAYIERIVNMVRPRKLLYMAVGKNSFSVQLYPRALCSFFTFKHILADS
jgi:hypothetical protein